MKTITQYQPMIFSRLAAVAHERVWRRRQFRNEALRALAYVALGLWLAADTGCVAWDWQFWLMFTPMFAASELALHEVSRG